ncbi:MAG TPA: hypothetical protein VNF68_15425 [Candidatus Baltobacteraceae bacterium]|nr:hypothetical protein [Candidatus Baltobacteraceae bacterium]
MKVHLLHKSRDFDSSASIPAEDDVIRDLGLAIVFDAMGSGDAYLREAARKVMLASENDVDTILYRQDVLRDCLARRTTVQQLYDVAVDAIEAERRDFLGGLARRPGSLLFRCTSLLEMFADTLRRLHAIAQEHAFAFESEGMATLLTMLRAELTDDYIATVRRHLKQLQFPNGMLMSAELGDGNKGTAYVLRRGSLSSGGWMEAIFGTTSDRYSFQIAGRDDAGARALEDLRARGLSLVARAVGKSTDHVLSFLKVLRFELAYYLGCANLHDRLSQLDAIVCFPQPAVSGDFELSASGLYDPGLALSQTDRPVSNSLAADGKQLVIITGANQGGKSTFLRSVGTAQLMMQCGMFVAAQSFAANLVKRLSTHFKREEDPTMTSGKLDEELGRMSAIADHLLPRSLVLFNESFSATNEREGSEIAEQIVTALIERNIKVVFVTHQYEFARRCFARLLSVTLFLKAERLPDGTRTFKIIEGAPEDTSHGKDLYRQIFLRSTGPADRERQAVAQPGSERGSHDPA